MVSQGTVLGGNCRSWSAPVYIIGGAFPYAFRPDEDPVPVFFQETGGVISLLIII